MSILSGCCQICCKDTTFLRNSASPFQPICIQGSIFLHKSIGAAIKPLIYAYTISLLRPIIT